MYPKNYLNLYPLWYCPQSNKFHEIVGIKKDARNGDKVITKQCKDISKYNTFKEISLPLGEELEEWMLASFLQGHMVPVDNAIEPIGIVLARAVNYKVLSICCSITGNGESK